MARYRISDVFKFLTEQNCVPSGDRVAAGIAFVTADGHGFILPIYDPEWIDADLVDDILANRWISPCAHALTRFD